MVELLVGRSPGNHVEFVDASGAAHVVVLARCPWLCPRWRARRKLERWGREGRAFYTPPLTFVKVIRRR